MLLDFLSNFIVNEIRQGEEGKIFQSKKKVTIYSGNKRKVKENCSVSYTELYLILKGVTATSKQGRSSSVNGTNLSGAESTASV